jgi:hypothetical protein
MTPSAGAVHPSAPLEGGPAWTPKPDATAVARIHGRDPGPPGSPEPQSSRTAIPPQTPARTRVFGSSRTPRFASAPRASSQPIHAPCCSKGLAVFGGPPIRTRNGCAGVYRGIRSVLGTISQRFRVEGSSRIVHPNGLARGGEGALAKRRIPNGFAPLVLSGRRGGSGVWGDSLRTGAGRGPREGWRAPGTARGRRNLSGLREWGEGASGARNPWQDNGLRARFSRESGRNRFARFAVNRGVDG